jgi:hypothetical protein
MSELRAPGSPDCLPETGVAEPQPASHQSYPHPQKGDAWLARARDAETRAERLVYLSRAVTLDPEQPLVRRLLQDTLQAQLDEDAFLAYQRENAEFYYLRTGDNIPVTIPKGRAVSLPYPPAAPSPLQPAFRRLRWALLGLLPAGIGAVIFAPLAARAAFLARQRPLSAADRVRSRVVLLASLLLFVIGLALLLVLFLHLF